jgi:hypothetical protein
MPLNTKRIFLAAFFAMSALAGCAQPDEAPPQAAPPTPVQKPLSPIDQLISRPDCKVVLIGEDEENRRLSEKASFREIITGTLEFSQDSKVTVNIDYKTYYSPGNPFDVRVTHADPVSLSYLKTAQGLLIFADDNSPLAFLKLKYTPQKAELSYFDENLKRQMGKGTLEFTIKDCRH